MADYNRLRVDYWAAVNEQRDAERRVQEVEAAYRAAGGPLTGANGVPTSGDPPTDA